MMLRKMLLATKFQFCLKPTTNLSMFSRHFLKQELREMIPGLSKWQINHARRHAAKEGPGHQVVPIPIKRTRPKSFRTLLMALRN